MLRDIPGPFLAHFRLKAPASPVRLAEAAARFAREVEHRDDRAAVRLALLALLAGHPRRARARRTRRSALRCGRTRRDPRARWVPLLRAAARPQHPAQAPEAQAAPGRLTAPQQQQTALARRDHASPVMQLMGSPAAAPPPLAAARVHTVALAAAGPGCIARGSGCERYRRRRPHSC